MAKQRQETLQDKFREYELQNEQSRYIWIKDQEDAMKVSELAFEEMRKGNHLGKSQYLPMGFGFASVTPRFENILCNNGINFEKVDKTKVTYWILSEDEKAIEYRRRYVNEIWKGEK